MDRALLLERFDFLLPLAARWAAGVEDRILRKGVPLSAEELVDAQTVGVCAPERVRLLSFASVPTPREPLLRTAAAALHFLTPTTCGLALRYGIFVRADCWRDRALVAHELVHTAQYERLGGIEPFLRQYLMECVRLGYLQSPLEQEAIALSRRIYPP